MGRRCLLIISTLLRYSPCRAPGAQNKNSLMRREFNECRKAWITSLSGGLSTKKVLSKWRTCMSVERFELSTNGLKGQIV
jgi:hypothetical protein